MTNDSQAPEMPPVRSYSVFIDRILETLKADAVLENDIMQWRFGDRGDRDATREDGGAAPEQVADAYPLLYVTVPPNPEVSREPITGTESVDAVPPQIREWEFWAVITVTGETPEAAQRKLYDLIAQASNALETNIQLKDQQGKNPLCINCTYMQQRRIEPFRGTLLESMTIRIRPILVVSHEEKKY